MVIFKDKNVLSCSLYPNTDWTKGSTAEHVVEDGTELANKILANAPYYDFVLDNDGELIDISPNTVLREQAQTAQIQLNSLIPTAEEVRKAEIDLQVLTLLQEVKLI